MMDDRVDLASAVTSLRAAAPQRPSVKRRLLVVAGLFAVTLLVAQACQRSQIRISQSQAITIARARLDFTPRQTQVRFVRQGMSSHPYWAVSLSIPAVKGGFRRLTVVRVDANSGSVASVTQGG
jgi:hypothetical protein